MTADTEGTMRIRRLGDADVPAAAALARAAFADHPIYQASLGLGAAGFEALWRAFLSMAVGDPAARAFAAEIRGEVVGVLVMARPDFPSLGRGLRFLGRLWGAVGTGPVLRYLRLCASYGRVMRRPEDERRIEAQGLWLAASPTRSGTGVGGALVRHGLREMALEGRTLITGVVDARNRRLVSYYRRMGFTVGDPVPVPGGMHSRLEMRLPARGDREASASGGKP